MENVENTQNNEISETSEVKEEVVETTKKSKREIRKEKRLEKLKGKLLNPVDIKFRGILSYRYVRVLAWLCLAVSQLLFLNNIHATLNSSQGFVSPVWQSVISVIGGLSTPLFLIATFGVIFSNKQSFFRQILFYGGVYIGIGVGLAAVYYHYVYSLFNVFGAGGSFDTFLAGLYGQKAEINVFSDLFLVVLFHFFINYTPTKHFQGKKIIFFRLFALIPVFAAIAFYVIKIIESYNIISLPLAVYPFLTTKSPLIHLVFMSIIFWFKNRERIYLKLGATRKQYHEYLKTNRNSLAFSIQLSLMFLLFAFIDLLMIFVIGIVLFGFNNVSIEGTIEALNKLECGECIALVTVIPVVLLFSYTKQYKDNKVDMLIPVAGIGLVAFVYLEGIFEILMNFLNKA